MNVSILPIQGVTFAGNGLPCNVLLLEDIELGDDIIGGINEVLADYQGNSLRRVPMLISGDIDQDSQEEVFDTVWEYCIPDIVAFSVEDSRVQFKVYYASDPAIAEGEIVELPDR